MGDGGSGLVTLLTAVAGLVAAVLGVLQYFKYRTRRDRIENLSKTCEMLPHFLPGKSTPMTSVLPKPDRRT